MARIQPRRHGKIVMQVYDTSHGLAPPFFLISLPSSLSSLQQSTTFFIFASASKDYIHIDAGTRLDIMFLVSNQPPLRLREFWFIHLILLIIITNRQSINGFSLVSLEILSGW